ncbi:GP183 protein, partial [Atractosteus spatula]|nr:GP183 protein [Atractosteus spatula]
MELSEQMMFSNTSCPPYQYKKEFSVWFSIFYTVICIAGVSLNGLALYSIHKRKEKITSSLLYLINLTMADFFFAFLLPLRIVYFAMGFRWKLGEAVCRISGYLFYLNIYSGINFMVCLSVDRYIAVMHPITLQRFRNVSFAKGICIFVWIFTCAVNSITMFLPNLYVKNGTDELCMEYSTLQNNPGLPGKVLISCLVSYCLPLLILFFCYWCVGVKVCQMFWKNPVRNKPGRFHRKSLRIILVVLLGFCLCYTPYHVNLAQHMVKVLRGPVACDTHQSFKLYLQSTISVMNLSFFFDPFIYFSAFKNHRLFAFKCQTRRVIDNPSSSSKTSSSGTD